MTIHYNRLVASESKERPVTVVTGLDIRRAENVHVLKIGCDIFPRSGTLRGKKVRKGKNDQGKRTGSRSSTRCLFSGSVGMRRENPETGSGEEA